MTWREVRYQVQDRIKKGITNILVIRQRRLRRQRLRAGKALPENKSKSKQRKKVISPQEAVAIIGSMIIVLMGLGGLGPSPRFITLVIRRND